MKDKVTIADTYGMSMERFAREVDKRGYRSSHEMKKPGYERPAYTPKPTSDSHRMKLYWVSIRTKRMGHIVYFCENHWRTWDQIEALGLYPKLAWRLTRDLIDAVERGMLEQEGQLDKVKYRSTGIHKALDERFNNK